MRRDDRFDSCDRFAGACARLATRSKKEPLDIVDSCNELRQPIPIDAEDLRSLSLLCERWGIRCNLDDEPAGPWMTSRKAMPE